MNTTLSYYAEHAEDFSEGTIHVDFSEVADRFLAYIPEGGSILDFGCGSGRDSKYFMERGYSVNPVDGSEALCRLAESYLGIAVRHLLFQDLSDQNAYDGIWACASVLHLPKDELPDVFRRMIDALTSKGTLYVSFKYGDFEGERNGRFFSNFTEVSFAQFLKRFPELSYLEQWISVDVRPGRESEKWLNVILRKTI